MSAQLRKLFTIPQSSSMQNLGIFWSTVRHPFSMSKFEQVSIIQENTKPLGPTSQPPGPNHGTACADRVWTMAVALSSHSFAAHWFRRPRPLPRVAIRGVPRRQAPPFRPSSSAHAPPLLLLAPCQRRPPLPYPPRVLELHPALVHLYDPSSFDPDNPSGPSPPLLPAQCVPQWIASSVSPRPPNYSNLDSSTPVSRLAPFSTGPGLPAHQNRPAPPPSSHGFPPLFLATS
jgi:hypothetical protein